MFDETQIPEIDVASLFNSYQAQEFAALAAELQRREMEALSLYESLPFQDRYHRCPSKEVALIAGNQTGKALRDDMPVLTPQGWVAIGTLIVGDTVIGGDGKPCKVTGVFPQGVKPMFEAKFDDGASVVCCEDHLWRCKLGKRERFTVGRSGPWHVHSLKEIRAYGGDAPAPIRRAVIPVAQQIDLQEQPVPIDPYVLGVLLGDGCIKFDSVGFTSGDTELVSEVAKHVGEGLHIAKTKSHQYQYAIKTDRVCYGVRNYAHEYRHPMKAALEGLSLQGCGSQTKFIPDIYLWNSHATRLAMLQGLMDTDGSCDRRGHLEYCTTSPRLANDFVALARSLGCKVKMQWRTTYCNYRGVKVAGKPSARIRLRATFNPFRLERKAARWKHATSTCDERVLHTIHELPAASCTCIAVDSPERTFITKDYIVTHNSLAGFVEDARAVTGQDPFDKYPKENGILVCLGMDVDHIGLVIYRYLFEPGAFHIIQDEFSGKWRVWKPWNDEDMRRKKQAVPAPPLIPARYIKNMAWEKKGEHIFSVCELTTGWKIYAMGSKGDPKQGFQCDLAHIDEDIERSEWYQELLGRLTMREGRLRWTALPHVKNDALVNLMERADDEKNLPYPSTVVIRATVFDNPFQDAKTREENIKRWRQEGEDVYRKRALGEPVTDSILMYPTFHKDIHGLKLNFAPEQEPEVAEIERVLRASNMIPPSDWCKYAIVDPGHTVCAAIFIAVPPPALGDWIIAFNELYIQHCDATKFGHHFRMVAENLNFQAFLIDAHGGALRDIGGGLTPREQYSAKLREANIASVETKHAFIAGSDDVQGRALRLREWLSIRRDGTTRFRVITQRCPNLLKEFNRFKKKKIKDMVTDEPDTRTPCHAIQCVEYAAAHGCKYVKPINPAKRFTIVDAWERMKSRNKEKRAAQASLNGTDFINLGPQG